MRHNGRIGDATSLAMFNCQRKSASNRRMAMPA
jgi:hypothetical protein